MRIPRLVFYLLAAVAAACLRAQDDDPNARPPVTQTDVAIVKRAAQILDTPATWNRADNRVCRREAKTFSLYCALEKASEEVSGKFEHRSASMQEARFVIEEIAPNVQHYNHRLMDYNNDPNTTFRDIQGVFWLLEKHIAMRLRTNDDQRMNPGSKHNSDSMPLPRMHKNSSADPKTALLSKRPWNRRCADGGTGLQDAALRRATVGPDQLWM